MERPIERITRIFQRVDSKEMIDIGLATNFEPPISLKDTVFCKMLIESREANTLRQLLLENRHIRAWMNTLTDIRLQYLLTLHTDPQKNMVASQ
jgi:hypothetical protein